MAFSSSPKAIFKASTGDMKTLRQRDSIELKRAISKLKKTIDALEGTIAGFGENIIIATPSFATIHKQPEVDNKDDGKGTKFDVN